MSASYCFEGAPQPPQSTALTTVEQDIATPKGTALHKVIKIRIANVSAVACKVDLYWYDGSSHVFYHANVAADSSIEIDDPLIFASEGTTVTKLRGTAEANSRLVATVFVALAGTQLNAR
jgi:hypothetical protein